MAVRYKEVILKEHISYKCDVVYSSSFHLNSIFPSMIFCGEAAKKTSIDGLKWRDLVMGK